MPVELVRAIATVESGRLRPAGRVQPWPWTISVGGTGYFYDTKQQAVAAARVLQQAGVRSIDVGCMQVNLLFHPQAFATLDDAFEPSSNVAYAVRFLSALFHQTGSWPQAAAAYHSQTPQVGLDYQRRVMALYPMRLPGSAPRPVEVAEAADPGDRTPEFLRLQRRLEEDHARLQTEYGQSVPRPEQAAARPHVARPARRAAGLGLPSGAARKAEVFRLAGTSWLDGSSRN